MDEKGNRKLDGTKSNLKVCNKYETSQELDNKVSAEWTTSPK